MCIPFIVGISSHLLSSFQSFRSVERPSFLRLIRYLCPKLNTSDIPKRTCIGDVVMEKVEKLDGINSELVMGIDSLHQQNIKCLE